MSRTKVNAGIFELLKGIPAIATACGDRMYSNRLPQEPTIYPAVYWIIPLKNSVTDLSGKRAGIASGTVLFYVFHPDCDAVEDLREALQLGLSGKPPRPEPDTGFRFTAFSPEEPTDTAPVWREELNAFEADSQFAVAWEEAVSA